MILTTEWGAQGIIHEMIPVRSTCKGTMLP